MNAYELADGLKKMYIENDNHGLFNKRIQNMLRQLQKEKEQQANRIAELERLVSDMVYEKSSGVYDRTQTNAEPVAWMSSVNGETVYVGYEPADGYLAIPLYTTPQTKPISDEEIVEIYKSVKQDRDLTWEEWCKEQIEFARTIEERHGIK